MKNYAPWLLTVVLLTMSCARSPVPPPTHSPAQSVTPGPPPLSLTKTVRKNFLLSVLKASEVATFGCGVSSKASKVNPQLLAAARRDLPAPDPAFPSQLTATLVKFWATLEGTRPCGERISAQLHLLRTVSKQHQRDTAFRLDLLAVADRLLSMTPGDGAAPEALDRWLAEAADLQVRSGGSARSLAAHALLLLKKSDSKSQLRAFGLYHRCIVKDPSSRLCRSNYAALHQSLTAPRCNDIRAGLSIKVGTTEFSGAALAEVRLTTSGSPGDEHAAATIVIAAMERKRFAAATAAAVGSFLTLTVPGRTSTKFRLQAPITGGRVLFHPGTSGSPLAPFCAKVLRPSVPAALAPSTLPEMPQDSR